MMRKAKLERETKETKVQVSLNLDGTGEYDISTGIGFLDHMLEQLSRHSLIDLKVRAQGDLHIDFHHTTEDTGIVIGEAIHKALGDPSPHLQNPEQNVNFKMMIIRTLKRTKCKILMLIPLKK